MDIIDAIEHIQKYTNTLNEQAFSQNIQTQDAVIRRFQIIGEAASRIPDTIRNQYPDIAWKKIVGQRNFIIHDYASIRPQEIWRVIQEDLPDLLPKMKVILSALEKAA